MHVHVWCWGKGALLFVTESVLLFFSPRRQRPAAYGWAGLGSAFRISTCPLPWHSHPANEYPSPFSELSPSLLPALLRNYTLACLKSSFSGLAKYPGFLLRPVSWLTLARYLTPGSSPAPKPQLATWGRLTYCPTFRKQPDFTVKVSTAPDSQPLCSCAWQDKMSFAGSFVLTVGLNCHCDLSPPSLAEPLMLPGLLPGVDLL